MYVAVLRGYILKLCRIGNNFLVLSFADFPRLELRNIAPHSKNSLRETPPQ